MCLNARSAKVTTVTALKSTGEWFEQDGHMMSYCPPTEMCPWPSVMCMPITVPGYLGHKDATCYIDEMYEVDPNAFESDFEYSELMAKARLYYYTSKWFKN